jgi:aspartyl-tRNA(Asn)/glutamyl-tRNA(Gln) amidotransferase subunit A
MDLRAAEDAARASESRWRQGSPLSPLDGMALTIKDNMLVRGLRAVWGSRLYESFVPEQDELPVARLRAAGAVILGKTNCPEFTLQGYTANPVFGVTGNPWDPALTPGGSSGGAAAAVAAGLVPLAVGTDGGGSIRRPASHTGLVGMKPSHGRVPRGNGFPMILHDFEVVGPLARTVEDAAALLAVMSGPDTRDAASLPFSPIVPPLSDAPTPQRILYIPHFGDAPVDREVANSVAKATGELERLGHTIQQGPVPFDTDAFGRAWSVVSQAGLAWLMRSHPGWRGRIGKDLGDMARAGESFSAADYVDALDTVRTLRRRLAEAFAETDLLLTPTAAALPWPASDSHPPIIDNHPAGPRGHAVFTAFVNAAGCPAISVPCEPSSRGLPIGFQLVGRWGEDERLLAVAAQYERAQPWVDRWPSAMLDAAA